MLTWGWAASRPARSLTASWVQASDLSRDRRRGAGPFPSQAKAYSKGPVHSPPFREAGADPGPEVDPGLVAVAGVFALGTGQRLAWGRPPPTRGSRPRRPRVVQASRIREAWTGGRRCGRRAWCVRSRGPRPGSGRRQVVEEDGVQLGFDHQGRALDLAKDMVCIVEPG